MQTGFSGSATQERGDNSISIPAVVWHVDESDLEQSIPNTFQTASNNHRRPSLHELDRRKSTPRSRCQGTAGKNCKDGHVNAHLPAGSILIDISPKKDTNSSNMTDYRHDVLVRMRFRGPWSISLLTFITTIVAMALLTSIIHSFSSRQQDHKGCRMSYMRPSFVKLSDFDTEHTHFASKYSLYLYREGGIDEDAKVRGVPVLFIPGNAGSYKQVRPIAAEAANYFHDVLRYDSVAITSGARKLDFFTVDFNEDITAFHGRTLLDQAEYLNEAIAYILSLYHDPRRSERDSNLPDPTSVIILGHSMGGIVARTMLVMPNYQSNSINTIITMSAPHARPPVSFDGEIVETYRRINNYWRDAYSQKWANNNPLWHVTLISIAGGGLDTVVPSDYASLESLVPDTHGFTVFTSSVPNVWTGMDHQAILWCDQFRNVVVRSLYDIIDSNRPAQTKPRADRMRSFKKWFLTGLENFAEKSFSQKNATTVLTLEDKFNVALAPGERLVIRNLGQNHKRQAYLLPIPPQGTPGGKKFTLLTDKRLDKENEPGKLEVLFCSISNIHSGHSSTLFSMNMEFTKSNSGSNTPLLCKNAASDVINIPASTKKSKEPFYLNPNNEIKPFSYLQYDLEDISEHQFVAVVDKSTSPSQGWVMAEFSDNINSHLVHPTSLRILLAFGMEIALPSNRPMVVKVEIPALRSSLLAYTLDIENQLCSNKNELFSPLLRQFISEPYESKYFVNFKKANINLHGASPFMPPPLRNKDLHNGLSLQFWTDPTCNSSLRISLKFDLAGSLGKLYMRYRTVFTAFPLLVIALVLRKQFRVYDETGVFMSFSMSLDLCLRQSLPLLILALSLISLSLSRVNSTSPGSSSSFGNWGANTTESQNEFTKNDLLIGSQDPFFWFMVPLIGLVCIGVCVIVHYITFIITNLLSLVYCWAIIQPAWLRIEEKKRTSTLVFSPSTPRRRLITIAILFFLVSTLIPYQFAYLVACLVQIATCTKALRIFWDARSTSNSNFYNYAHSILILMLWILPINLPILVVWIHNLAVHWLTPFSSHHNVLSIMPFILLVETITSGKIAPRINSRFRHVTSLFFLCIAIYAAIYGMTYAYMLHHLVNIIAGWLFTVHCCCNTNLSVSTPCTRTEPENFEKPSKQGKTP